jgi:hypothetical protein
MQDLHSISRESIECQTFDTTMQDYVMQLMKPT